MNLLERSAPKKHFTRNECSIITCAVLKATSIMNRLADGRIKSRMRTWVTLIRSKKRKQQDMMLAEPVSQSKTMVLKSSGFLFVGNALLES